MLLASHENDGREKGSSLSLSISINNHIFQHVKISHETDGRDKGSSESEVPPVGEDGITLRTSVCSEIEESVNRAADIERKLANSKVLSINTIALRNVSKTVKLAFFSLS